MMAANHRTILRGLTLTVLGAWCLSALGQARPQTVPTPVRDVVESVVIERDDIGGEARVHIQKWILHGRMVVEALELPAIDGVRMVQLAAGEVTTVIAGERAERAEGEWWTVPAGEPLGLVTGNDAAILWTISVQPE